MYRLIEPTRGGRGAFASACLLVGLAACGNGDVRGRIVTDSAGVRLTVSADARAVFATLPATPTLSLGGAEASGPTRFFRIQGIHVDPSGRLWVADGQSAELRIFRADGSHWKTRGGRGEGPGEFLQIRLLGASNGDSVLVGDAGADRVTLFTPDGELVRTERLPGSDRPAPRPFAVFGDGSVLGQWPRIVAAASLEPGQVLTDSVDLVRVDLDASTTRPYGSAPGPLWLWTGRSQVPVPFTVNASFDLLGDEVHLVSGPEFRIRVLEGGASRRSYGIDREPRAVGDADVRAYERFIEDHVAEGGRADHLAALGHERRPSWIPGYDRLLVSEDGHVWAQVYESDLSQPHDWDVYDPEGRFVGQVRVGAGFFPMAITREAVVGVWRDTLGVEHVRAYRLARP